MKKTIVFCFCILFATTLNAQQDTLLLKEYTGVYKFEPGKPISIVTVLYNNGSLSYVSDMGEGRLINEGPDTFSVSAYNGKVYFKRDSATKKITGITVSAMNYRFDGLKEIKEQPTSFISGGLNKEFLMPRKKKLITIR